MVGEGKGVLSEQKVWFSPSSSMSHPGRTVWDLGPEDEKRWTSQRTRNLPDCQTGQAEQEVGKIENESRDAIAQADCVQSSNNALLQYHKQFSCLDTI